MVGSGVLGNVVSGFGGKDGDEEDVVRIEWLLEMVKVMLYREVEKTGGGVLYNYVERPVIEAGDSVLLEMMQEVLF